jgi:hypothetical protein
MLFGFEKAYPGQAANAFRFNINGNTAASITMTASRLSSNMCQDGTLGQRLILACLHGLQILLQSIKNVGREGAGTLELTLRPALQIASWREVQ